VRSYEAIAADTAKEHAFSNHSEYEVWAERYCYRCVYEDMPDGGCPIIGAAMVVPGWPKEWTRERERWTIGGNSGVIEYVDSCTEFEERRGRDDPDEPQRPLPTGPTGAVHPIPGQLDIVDAFLEKALDEWSTTKQEALF
jgi:hypothetical protein